LKTISSAMVTLFVICQPAFAKEKKIERKIASGPLKVSCRMVDYDKTPIVITVDTYRTGALLQGNGVVRAGIDGTEAKYDKFNFGEITGFYNAHGKFLVYFNNLVDENAAVLDLQYDFSSNQGTATLRQRSGEHIGSGAIACTMK
jgi:hypothetical protein